MDGTTRHVGALDGLRAVAALAVVGTHVAFATGAVQPGMAGALLARLDVGVALFFALSGYLLVRPWLRTSLLDAHREPQIGRYALRRAARILPVFWLVLAAVLLVEGTGVLGETLRGDLDVTPVVVIAHLLVAQAWTGDLFASFAQTWSLSTEVAFYLLLPLIGAALVRLNRAVDDHGRRFRRFSTVCGAAVAAGVGTAAYCATGLPGAGSVLRLSVLGHLAWFAAGIWVSGARITGRGLPAATARPGELAAVAAALLVVAASPLGGGLLFSAPSPAQAALRELAYAAVAGLGVLAASSAGPGSLTLDVLDGPVLRWVGARSYSLFLWHLPVLFMVMTLTGSELFSGSFVVVGGLTLGVSLLLAHVSFVVVEAPAQRWSHRRTPFPREQAQQTDAESLRDD